MVKLTDCQCPWHVSPALQVRGHFNDSKDSRASLFMLTCNSHPHKIPQNVPRDFFSSETELYVP